MKIMSIVSWVLVAVLAVGVGVMAFMGQKNAGRAAELEETLSTVQADFEASQQELSGAKDALAAAENSLSTAQADSAAQAQKAQEQTARVETLAKDLAAKEEKLASVTAEMEEAVKQARQAGLMELQQAISLSRNQAQVGRILPVLIEGKRDRLKGFSHNYLPVVLKNDVAAMTGFQEAPDLSAVLRALLPTRFLDLPAPEEEVETVLQEELARRGPSVLVARGRCVTRKDSRKN